MELCLFAGLIRYSQEHFITRAPKDSMPVVLSHSQEFNFIQMPSLKLDVENLVLRYSATMPLTETV